MNYAVVLVFLYLFSIFIVYHILCMLSSNIYTYKNLDMTLRITVPETMSFSGVFEDVLKKYTVNYNRTKIKTSEFGTLFEMVYIVKLKKGADEKEFIDSIRTKNANLNISLTQREFDFGVC